MTLDLITNLDSKIEALTIVREKMNELFSNIKSQYIRNSTEQEIKLCVMNLLNHLANLGFLRDSEFKVEVEIRHRYDPQIDASIIFVNNNYMDIFLMKSIISPRYYQGYQPADNTKIKFPETKKEESIDSFLLQLRTRVLKFNLT